MFCSVKPQLYSISLCYRGFPHVLQHLKPRERVGMEGRKSTFATFTQISFALSAHLILSVKLMDLFKAKNIIRFYGVQST